jgi:CheY-like chemotaxis protein
MAHKILVVDDAQVDRGSLEKIVAEAGYVVSTAASGMQAVERAKTDRPDVILMDVNMPDLDGFGATRKLRADATTKDIAIVFVTSKGQKADRAWGQMLGAKGYITKPYTKEQILEQLRAL